MAPRIGTTPAPVTTSTSSAPPPAATQTKPSDALQRFTDAMESVGRAMAARSAKVDSAVAALTRAGVPKATLDAVAVHLSTLPDDQLGRDVRLLTDVAATPNADRAARAYDLLATKAAASPEAKARLTQPLREVLVRGVAEPRTFDPKTGANPTGLAGALGVNQAGQAADALVGMSKENFEQATQLLAQAGTGPATSPRADAQAERALIMKAVAARGDLLQTRTFDPFFKGAGLPTPGDLAMKQIGDFAKDIRGMGRLELMRQTSGIDLETADTSAVDPMNLLRVGPDTTGNNDGLYQRYEDTCAPTNGEIIRAESDPIYALKAHHELDAGLPAGGEVSKAQLAELNAHGGATVDRLQNQKVAAARLDLLNKGRALGLGEGFLGPLWQKLIGQSAPNTYTEAFADVSLAIIRSRNGGAPSEADVKALVDFAKQARAGMDICLAAEDIASPATHRPYRYTDITAGAYTPVMILAHLPQVEARLRDGIDVPLRIGEGDKGHALTLTDVRGVGSGATYEVADPYSGRTIWASQADLLSGAFIKQLGLGWPGITGFGL